MGHQLKKGVIELIILKLINNREYYGYEISQYINKYIKFKESSVYIILSRLEQNGKVKTRKDRNKLNNKLVKYYIISADGKEYLKEVNQQWEEINILINEVEKIGE